MVDKDNLKLCYVEGDWAYFTSQDLSSQWGSDWNDAPYEHNAGSPYKDDNNQWVVIKIAFEGPFKQPCDDYLNSPYSVQMINMGRIPWLHANWILVDNEIGVMNIFAGTSLTQFIEMVNEVKGGKIYLPQDIIDD